MTDVIVHLPKLFDYQQEISDHPARFKVLAIGRRAGKSFFAKIDALDRAINKGQAVWLVFPTYNTSQRHWRDLLRMVGEAPFVTWKNQQQRTIEFSSGGYIEVKSADKPNNLRGSGLDHVVMDEAAFIKAEVFQDVILPALADKQGSVLLISTPNGKNWFYRAFKQGQKEDEFWASWQYPSTISPLISIKERDLQKSIMPRMKFRQEWLASFQDTGGGVFIGVEDTLILPPLDKEANFPERKLAVGIDWGRKNDYTVISAFHMDTGEQMYLDMFTDIGFEVQKNRIIAAVKRLKPLYIFVEGNHIGMIMSELLKSALDKADPEARFKKITLDNSLKRELVEHYAALVEHKGVKHFNSDHLYGEQQEAQLSSYNLEYTAKGLNITYNNTSSAGHDDIVVANFLAVQKIRLPQQTSKMLRAVPNPFY